MTLKIRRIDCATDDARREITALRAELSPQGDVVRPEGKARTILGYQARRPSLQDYENEFSRMQIPVLLIVGDQDEPCLETTLWLKKTLPNAGLWKFGAAASCRGLQCSVLSCHLSGTTLGGIYEAYAWQTCRS